MKNKKDLWLSLKNYHFDHLADPSVMDHLRETFGGVDASTRAFASKLARKLGWDTAFAIRAINEYKKFVFLGVTSKFSVTPSKVIDQVWHEHLLFSRAYREFCDEIIDYRFDHNPELVRMTDQTGTFNAQYTGTLELYAKEFNMDPPEDIWGTPKFSKEEVRKNGYTSKKKDRSRESYSSSSDDDTLYFMMMNSHSPSELQHHAVDFGGFGGGKFGGGGAGASFEVETPVSHHSHTDTVSVDTSSHSDSSCSSSSCSSSCGGGGCGGD